MKRIFNLLLGPHFGGVHEATIKAAKRTFGILSKGEVTDEGLHAAIGDVEGLITSRAILAPSHFLFGQVGGSIAQDLTYSTPFTLTQRWQYVQHLVCQFWQQWMNEFLETLMPRRNWNRVQQEIDAGDVVLVVDPQTPHDNVATRPSAQSSLRTWSTCSSSTTPRR